MAGHSKWDNIKHRKQLVDAKRSKLFQRLSKDLQNAIKLGKNPKTNSLLRNTLAKAKAANMTKETILKVLKNLESDYTKEKYFWLTGFFAKKIYFMYKMSGDYKPSKVHDLKKVIQKSKMEILPNTAVAHLFQEVFKVIVLDVIEKNVEEIIKNFSIYDFHFNEETKETILFFDSSKELKKFQIYFSQKQKEIHKIQQTYLPLTRITILPDLKKEFFMLCDKVLNSTECLLIVNNLVK